MTKPSASVDKPRRERADVLLCAQQLAESRAKAQSMILAGEVFAGTERIDKPGQLVPSDTALRVVARRRFVSRGGEKLDRALEALGSDAGPIEGIVAVDVGASTGGFTDCLLQRGAAKVVAVDVGWGQLDARLRADPRVECRERTNARDLGAADFAEPIDLVVVDASFIGLDKLMPAIARIIRPGGRLLALVKPQFEAGRDAVRRGRGVIRDEAERQEAIATARGAIVAHNLTIAREVDSEVLGPKGNRERFVLAFAPDRPSKDG
ncbi:MAG: TlyA family RNA methyltransferase [Polyangiaceae bacterium]|nr:TlyA family RNA methyltransferase [Polyangiaceae bacterium]